MCTCTLAHLQWQNKSHFNVASISECLRCWKQRMRLWDSTTMTFTQSHIQQYEDIADPSENSRGIFTLFQCSISFVGRDGPPISLFRIKCMGLPTCIKLKWTYCCCWCCCCCNVSLCHLILMSCHSKHLKLQSNSVQFQFDTISQIYHFACETMNRAFRHNSISAGENIVCVCDGIFM